MRVIGVAAVDHPTTVNGHRACGPCWKHRRIDLGSIDIRRLNIAAPRIAIVLIEQLTFVAARYKAHLTLALGDVLQIDTNGDEVIVGMGPELNVLVPLNFFATFRKLEVKFAVVELDVRPKDVFDQIHNQ